MVSTLVLIYFGRPPLGHVITTTNVVMFHSLITEICSILIFHKKVWGWLLHNNLIMIMIFPEKYFSCYFLLTDQISLSGCLYFLIYWKIYVSRIFVSNLWRQKILKLTFPCCPVSFQCPWKKILIEKKLIFIIKPFFCVTRKSEEKFKYLNNEKNFQWTFIEANKNNSFRTWGRDFK